ncbi:MAG TPA: Sua5/YciO/YrdC/YwlC family protein [Acidimicrobiales bacterium]|jgi:tRNA A37 threonylcarbamoyladenosine synthetase subunit TsaC/SUA5/YrdC|nr:Sua5/YciO/YrdC/YwlC family protein [Acidimicrobiales bacterium]
MSAAPVLSLRQCAALEPALQDDQVVVVPGSGGYVVAALLGRPLGLAAWRALVPRHAAGVEPAVVVGHVDQAKALAYDWNEDARRLTDRLWPGPVAFVFSSVEGAPTLSGAREDELRVSMAGDRALRRLLRTCGPLATAALRDGAGQPISDAALAAAACAGDVALVLNGGASTPVEETVIDCQRTPPVVRHVGAIPEVYVEAALLMGARRRGMFMPLGALLPRKRPGSADSG